MTPIGDVRRRASLRQAAPRATTVNALLATLILAISPDAPIGQVFPQATEVLRAVFDQSGDVDFDRWPDLWTRRRGPGYPHYLRIEIVDEVPPGGGRALRMDLDSGAVAITSPPRPASADYEYAMEGCLRTEGLQADRAFFSLTLLDASYMPVDTFFSAKIQNSHGWKRVQLGPVAASSDRVRHIVLNLHLEPAQPHRADLAGTAWFGDLRVVRMPRVTLAATDGWGVYTRAGDVSAQCRVSGFVRPVGSVRFELVDVFGRVLEASDRPVPLQKPQPAKPAADSKTGSPPAATPLPAATPASASSARRPAAGTGGVATAQGVVGDGAGLSGTCLWKPAVPGPGFYRIRTTLRDGSAVLQREMTVAVLRDFPRRFEGEFGWSLSGVDAPLGRKRLVALLIQSGIHWLKCPVWLPADAPAARVADLSDLLERLTLQGIRIVGIIDRAPTAGVPSPSGGDPSLWGEGVPSIAETFTLDREQWQPSLEKTIVDLGGSVHWWQLGGDGDASFMGYLGLPEKIAQIRNELRRVENHVQIGLCWDVTRDMPASDADKPPWRFLSLYATPPLTARELSHYLKTPPPSSSASSSSRSSSSASLRNSRPSPSSPVGSSASSEPKLPPWMAGASEAGAGVQRWVMLEPIDAATYSIADRATDLAQRMIAAKVDGATVVFASQPFDDRRGLMRADGAPGELFLPWRNVATAISGREYLGEMALPARCVNRVFAGRSDAVMILWSREKTRLAALLGDGIHHYDLWGGELPVGRQDGAQALEIGPIPTLVTGLQKPIAAWQMACVLEKTRFSGAWSKRQSNGIEFVNTFDDTIEGNVVLVGPPGWTVKPQHAAFHLAKGERHKLPLEITPPMTSAIGRQTLRAEFEIAAPREFRFSAYCPVEIGFAEMQLDVATHLNAHGELEVEQRLTNNSDAPVSFRCSLFAPDRRRQLIQVTGLDRGSDVKTYRLPDGKSLVGKQLWLQAEEINGTRMLNHRFNATP